MLNTIEEKGIYIDAEKLSIKLPDPKDIIFYEVVMDERKKEDAYLITGNTKHFPSNLFVVTPRETLDIIMQEDDTNNSNLQSDNPTLVKDNQFLNT